MKLLVITNGIWYSGAQISTNEFLSFLTNLKSVEVKMVSCLGVNLFHLLLMLRFIGCPAVLVCYFSHETG
ncbi:MAG: hypothetical protein AT710_04935 [Thermocladium sp. ECH_B]|nr:MAG: hypothetical protein AT710_04935 [Thermocladium sp. ECH_B]